MRRRSREYEEEADHTPVAPPLERGMTHVAELRSRVTRQLASRRWSYHIHSQLVPHLGATEKSVVCTDARVLFVRHAGLIGKHTETGAGGDPLSALRVLVMPVALRT